MSRKTPSLITKLTFAILLMASAVVSSAGSMRCLVGLPMIEAKQRKVDCCHPAAKAKPKCCCIDVLKKPANDSLSPVVFEPKFDVAIILPSAISFDLNAPSVVTAQIWWPDVHGPPGIARTPSDPRAPPVG